MERCVFRAFWLIITFLFSIDLVVIICLLKKLSIFDIAKNWLSKISTIQPFLFVVFAGKKQPKQVGKCLTFEKKLT